MALEFLDDVLYWPKPLALVCIHYNSKVAIGREKNIMYNGKSYHIKWKLNTFRELLSSGIIMIDYVRSNDNMSNPLTKGLSRERELRDHQRKWVYNLEQVIMVITLPRRIDMSRSTFKEIKQSCDWQFNIINILNLFSWWKQCSGNKDKAYDLKPFSGF